MRGWLTFDYKLTSSKFREDIIIDYIQNERLYGLLQNKLLVETVLRSTLAKKTAKDLEPIFAASRSLIGLKLPSAASKDTIKVDNNQKISAEQLAEWRASLAAAKARIEVPDASKK